MNASYVELNNQLMLPNNPAYSLVKKAGTNDTKKAQLLKEKEDNKKLQTFLDFCREQAIAFTDTDKIVYSL